MADLTVTSNQTVKLQDGKMPAGAVNIRIDLKTNLDVAIGVFESVSGVFPVTTIFDGQSPGNYKFKGAAQDALGNWGDWCGTWTTLDYVAPSPPGDGDWEVV